MGRGTVARAIELGLLSSLLSFAAARDAGAFEFLGERAQLHGFADTRLVAVSDDFNDSWDLAQWAWVLDAELEFDIAPDGWGPFFYVSAYARVTAVYDCVWTRACGMFSSANTYGDRAKNLPDRLSSQKRTGFSGGIPVEEPTLFLENHRVGSIRKVLPFGPLFDVSEVASEYVFDRFRDYRFATGLTPLSAAGPWLPQNFVIPIAALSDRANPFNALDCNPSQTSAGPTGSCPGIFGGLELPFRPAPKLGIGDPPDRKQAQGIYYPNPALVEMIDDLNSHKLDQNFRQGELAWNRGASQQETKELKEAYLELEVLEGALWGRIGKQTIVWGKTELFRNQDRWNPSDIGAGPLAGLEESRIPLWAGRFVYSFYDVGPVSDVRLEVVGIFDNFEPTDLGICGEPLLPIEVCVKRVGIFAHGATALGIAGEIRPEDPWNALDGWETGVRLEWRWKRFSFALTDYYGYRDSTITNRFFTYERNVDPETGRPRRAGARGPCASGDSSLEADCLGVAPFTIPDPGDPAKTIINPLHRADVLANHHANQQLFAMICAGTIGAFETLDAAACAQSVFNSQEVVVLPIAAALGFALSGTPTLGGFVLSTLSQDDTGAAALTLSQADALLAPINGSGGLTAGLTDQQQALLGCGPFYGTDCDGDGIDFLNAEASVLLQAWAGFDGSVRNYRTDQGTQPGTIGFAGGPVATRFVDGSLTTIAGARSILDPAYDPTIDGCVGSTADFVAGDLPVDPGPGCNGATQVVIQPIFFTKTGQRQLFANELAAVSWNLEMLLVVSSPEDPDDPDSASAWDREPAGSSSVHTSTDFSIPPTQGGAQCSLITPQFCSAVRGLLALAALRNADLRAGGNGRFGRRDWLWQGGTPLVLDYEKKNVVGFSLDFAEDFTATNWGVEATWENDFTVSDNNAFDGHAEVDRYNLTISVDRPTFVRYLNRNRVFFFNSQWFIQYVKGYRHSFPGNGPWNVLSTMTVATAYFQDRLTSSMTAVYDFESNSGALIHSIGYRFTEKFRLSLAYRLFAGRGQKKRRPINPLSLENGNAARANQSIVNAGISPIRDLDQISLRLRYTF